MKKEIKNFDFAVAGNGMIGTLTAFLLKKNFPQKKVCLFGDKKFKNSASIAAGAMHAVFCEIEHNFYKSKIEQSNFEIGLKSRSNWLKFLNNSSLKKSLTSKDTYFYLKNDSSDFERKNFETACKIANDFKVLNKVNKNKIKNLFNGNISSNKFECYKIKNEFSFNPSYLIKTLTKLCIKDSVKIFENVENIYLKKGKYCINNSYFSDKLIITAGFNSHKLAKNLFKPVPIIKGVGTALILKNEYFKKISSVIRTSNRGGAQCGLHILPYDKSNGEIYVGAGNYISSEEEPWARTETIKWLLELVEEELIPKEVVYRSTIRTLLGYRPRSIDNIPSIGPVDDTLFYVSGTNRVGLSWASFIAEETLKWASNKKNDLLLNYYAPKRNLKSWGSLKDACDYFASSRVSNLIQHNLLQNKNRDIKKKYNQLYSIALNKNKTLNKKLNFKKDFVIDPDCYNYFEEKK